MAEPRPGSVTLTTGVDGGAGPRWEQYAARWAGLHGGIDPRASSALVRGWLRLAYGAGRALAAVKVPPGAVTLVGLAASALVPLISLFAGPWLFLAAGLVFAAAVADSADGAVAVLTSRATPLGAFDDPMADRLSEACWLLALWILGTPGWLVTACGGLAWLHEYARARATVAGMKGVGVITVAERPTRVVLVITALVLGGVAWVISPRLTPGAVTIVVALWTVIGVLGAFRLGRVIRSSLRS